jgi:hypothetical protein
MGYDDSDNQAADPNAPEPVAMFALSDTPGLSVDVDPDDNEAGHAILHSNSGTMVTFTVWNVGSAAGTCTVSLQVDGNSVKEWTSSEIQPNTSESTEVRGMGRYEKGSHEFVARVSPGAGHNETLQNGVYVLDD